MYNKIEEKARAMASKAKPAILNHGGKLYTLTFCQREWIYNVYQDGFWIVNLNCKTATTAKKYLKEWLSN